MELRIISGEFYEGKKVTVSINGDTVTRKVYYSRDAGDLYIVYQNDRYFYNEFE